MSTYEIKTESLEKLWKGLNGFSSTAADEINTYLHGAGYTLFSKSIEDLIPVSDRKKKHAKYSNALQDRLKSSRSRGGGFENLSVTIGSKQNMIICIFQMMAQIQYIMQEISIFLIEESREKKTRLLMKCLIELLFK